MVVSKPAGVPSQGDSSGDPTVLDLAKAELSRMASEGVAGISPNPFVVPVHRLDRPVSGAVVLARTSKAASRLAAQFRAGEVTKGYLAVVEGRPAADSGRVELWMHKDTEGNRVEWFDHEVAGASWTATRYQVLPEGPHRPTHMGVPSGPEGHGYRVLPEGFHGPTVVALFPETGRPHQLRATMAHLGAPIAGDLKYGAKAGMGRMIALHAHLLRFRHPVGSRIIQVLAPVPEEWGEFGLPAGRR